MISQSRPLPTPPLSREEYSNFVDVPMGTPHVPGTGHAHLYLNGLKLGRLYVPSARIGALPPGDHMVRVTLNANDHRAYVVDGDPVTAIAPLSVR